MTELTYTPPELYKYYANSHTQKNGLRGGKPLESVVNNSILDPMNKFPLKHPPFWNHDQVNFLSPLHRGHEDSVDFLPFGFLL